MLRLPRSFLEKNQHQIVLHQPESSPTDFDRIEVIGADALKAARSALNAIDTLPYEQIKPLQFHVKVLRDALSRRRMVGEGFRDAVGNLSDAVEGMVPDTAGALGWIHKELCSARTLSNRVADLLAAERDIGFHRGVVE